MLKRARQLAEKIRSHNNPEDARQKGRKPSASDLSLKKSPLTRLLANHVGRGGSSGMLQQVASAAIAEAGNDNVSASFLTACSS